jgi:hypothetical protein
MKLLELLKKEKQTMAKKNVNNAVGEEVAEAYNYVFNQTDDEYYLDPANNTIDLAKAIKFSKDMKEQILKIESVSKQEVRTLVKLFYQLQDQRKATREQIRAIEQDRYGKPASKDREGASELDDAEAATDLLAEIDTDANNIANEVNTIVLDWVNANCIVIENGIKKALELLCSQDEVGRWLMNIVGIGPVLAAGIMAYFDVTDKEYATQFISYAGLNNNNRPWLGVAKSTDIINGIIGNEKVITDDMVSQIAVATQWKYHYLRDRAYNEKKNTWSKSDLIKACSKIPYNKELHTLLWKVASSFIYQSNKKESVYGTLYREFLTEEMRKNEAGLLKSEAERALATKNYNKSTEAYKAYSQGKLPKAHLVARAMRKVEKIFVSHTFEQMYRVKYDKIPARYYILAKDPMHNKEIAPEVPYKKVTGEE